MKTYLALIVGCGLLQAAPSIATAQGPFTYGSESVHGLRPISEPVPAPAPEMEFGAQPDSAYGAPTGYHGAPAGDCGHAGGCGGYQAAGCGCCDPCCQPQRKHCCCLFGCLFGRDDDCCECPECEECDDCDRCCKDSTCDMYPHYPYFPEHHGWYYFRPYNYEHVLRQRTLAALGIDPVAPYATTMFAPIYAEFAEAGYEEPSPSQVPAPRLRTGEPLPDIQDIMNMPNE